MDANVKKNAIYSLVLVLVFVGIWWYRNNEKSADLSREVELHGETMGTTYTIKYLQREGKNFQEEIDSLLKALNQSLSTYIPTSEISRFNEGTILKYESPFFYPVLDRSYEIYKKTEGAFDPTVAPLVNAWGFGPDSTQAPSKKMVDSLLQFVNFDSIYFDTISVCKLKRGIELDFSAIAKGYGVDVIAGFLKGKGVEHMMVEIGGEVVCSGSNKDGNVWKIGIDNPQPAQGGDPLQAVVELKDKALATSGNYRNYYESNGKKFSHTINPKTGYPVAHTLLSASVFADNCMTADAYATAFMVMGLEKAKEILNKSDDLDAFLVYSDDKGKIATFTTEGIKPLISQ